MFRRHVGLVVLALVGLVLRALTVVAYPQAFLYTDSVRYLEFSHGWQPDFYRQAGYSMFLKAARQTGSLYTVSIVQHLIGLATGVAVYALLQRRGVPRWLSIVAAAPIVLDGFELTVEHFLLTDTVFLTLITAGLVTLLWQDQLTPWAAGAAGALLALSATVRVVSLPLVILTVAYLVVRRVGVRPLLAFAVAAAVPLGGYVTWFHSSWGSYGFSTAQAIFLYGRVAPIADCSVLNLTPRERALCPPEPASTRPRRSDYYIFVYQPPRDSDEPTVESFARKVFTQQPLAVSRAIGLDVAKYLIPLSPGPEWECTTEGLLLPAQPPTDTEYAWCQPNPRQAYAPELHPATMPPTTVLTQSMGWYAHTFRTPKLILGISVLIALAALLWRPRRRLPANRTTDILLLLGWGVGLLVLAVTGSMFDERYGLPALPLLPAAAALAIQRLRQLRRSSRAGAALTCRPT